ncbi:MAG: hypothetical protein AAF702_45730 [Chloroflexota bacterium]
MTKEEIIAELNHARRSMAAHDNALVRTDGCEAIDKAVAAIQAATLIEPGSALQADYLTARSFIATERGMRERVFKENPKKQERKMAECDTAGKALGRMALALGLEVPPAISEMEPEIEQMELIKEVA